jgi:hypothetical protein
MRCLGTKKSRVLFFKVNVFEADIPEALQLGADHSHWLAADNFHSLISHLFSDEYSKKTL